MEQPRHYNQDLNPPCGLITLANAFIILGHLNYSYVSQCIQYKHQLRLAGAFRMDKVTYIISVCFTIHRIYGFIQNHI